MRVMKHLILTVSVMALPGVAGAQTLIDPFPAAVPAAQEKPADEGAPAVPKMPDERALRVIVPEDAPPLPDFIHSSPVSASTSPEPEVAASPVFEEPADYVAVSQPANEEAAPLSEPAFVPPAEPAELPELSFSDLGLGDEAQADLAKPPPPDFVVEPYSAAAPAPVSIPVQEDTDVRWLASAGESLEQTLLRWSEDAGVELIWDCPGDFAVPEAVEAGGSYTQAVGGLLDMFQRQANRPVARLHVDPKEPQRVLVVSFAAEH